MKKSSLLLLIILVSTFGASAWGTCPQSTNDRGNCDTMYIEQWNEDAAGTGVHFVRIPIYITADIVASYDSIQAFVIPLCFTHSNPAKYCSVNTYWNRISWHPDSSLTRSIFRHLPSNDDPQVHNWMMDLFENPDNNGEEWDGVILEVTNNDNPGHFFLSLLPSGETDQRFIAGSRILLATMTMKLEDTMQVCIDTCLWEPYNRLAFIVDPEEGTIGITKIPRSGTGDSLNFKVCFPIMSDVKEVKSSDENKPLEFSLSQNYPNPFNPVTNFQFSLSKSSRIKIEIFNIIGQKVKVLVDEEMKPGVYVADWNSTDEEGKQVSSGIYFYRMQAGDFSDIKKMVLMK